MAHNSSILVRVISAALLWGNGSQLRSGGLHRMVTCGGDTLSCKISKFSCLGVSCAHLSRGQKRVPVLCASLVFIIAFESDE